MSRALPNEARARFVYVDCELVKASGIATFKWCHLVAEGNASETIRIVQASGAKARVRR